MYMNESKLPIYAVEYMVSTTCHTDPKTGIKIPEVHIPNLFAYSDHIDAPRYS